MYTQSEALAMQNKFPENDNISRHEQKNYTNQPLENLKNEKYTRLL